MRKFAPAVIALALFSYVPASHAGGFFAPDEGVGSVCGASCLAGQSELALQLELEYTLMYAHDPARPPLVIVNHPPAEGAGAVRARY
jgi:hypothetical protein